MKTLTDAQLKKSATKINDLLGNAGKSCIEAGQEFLLVRKQTEHGRWLRWLEENNYSVHKVGRLMAIARSFAGSPNAAALQDLPQVVLSALARKDVPKEVVQLIADRNRAGRPVTEEEAKQLVRVQKRVAREVARERAARTTVVKSIRHVGPVGWHIRQSQHLIEQFTRVINPVPTVQELLEDWAYRPPSELLRAFGAMMVGLADTLDAADAQDGSEETETAEIISFESRKGEQAS